MDATMNSFTLRAEQAEAEIENLIREIKNLENVEVGGAASDDQPVPEELDKLHILNSKLKYRLGILKRATEAELSKAH